MLIANRLLALLAAAALMALGAAAQTTVQAVGPKAPASTEAQVDRPVILVGSSAGAHFSSIKDGVSAARPGTLILVESGTYTDHWTLIGRGAAVVADEGATVVITGKVGVSFLPQGESAFLGDLVLAGGLEIKQCAGTVRLDGCEVPPPTMLVDSAPGQWFQNFPDCGSGESLQVVRDSQDVTFVDCTLRGASGSENGLDGSPGHHGLLVELSNVALYGCTLEGGAGASGTSPGHYPAFSGSGGDGLRVRGTGSLVRYCDLTATGGLGGTFTPSANGSFGVFFGCDGIDVRADSGSTAETCGAVELSFQIDTLSTQGTFPSYTVGAPPGSSIYMMIAEDTSWRAFAPANGVFHLDNSAQLVYLGVMPANGQLSRPFPAPAPRYRLGHGRVQLQVFAQIAGVDRYSAPRTLHVKHRWL